MKSKDYSAVLEPLPICTGCNLESEEGRQTVLGKGDKMTLVDMWLNSGSISVKNSVLSTVSVFRDKDNHIVVRDQECLSAGNLTVLRGEIGVSAANAS